MFFKKISALICAAFCAAPVLADETDHCALAARDAFFCSGEEFRKLDLAEHEGISFWMHRAGYLSKVLIEETGSSTVSQSVIERRILEMVSQQAQNLGRDFAFSDLEAATVQGMPVGTFSYDLKGKDGVASILHSYVAVRGRVLQVVSQMALKSATGEAVSLETAHSAALRAIQIRELGSDA